MLKEPTTTITDFIMGLEAFILTALLLMGRQTFPSQPYWAATIFCIGVAAILGGFYHGFERPSSYMWIYLCLAILMAIFCLAVLTDSFGERAARAFRWPVAALALVFLLVARVYPTRILAFTGVLAVLLALALVVYLRLMLIEALPGAGFVALGIATLLAGAAMMLGDVHFTFIWSFDRNGVYHLVQMVSLLFIYLGLSLRGSFTQ